MSSYHVTYSAGDISIHLSGTRCHKEFWPPTLCF